tara:strand:- start:3488 stop:4756 length:1269 start_codon:yes stop_codon:yes gene_type:complete
MGRGPPTCTTPRGARLPCNNTYTATRPQTVNDTTLTSCDKQWLAGTFELHDVCLRYNNNATAKPLLTSRNGQCGLVWGYSEYNFVHGKVQRVRAAMPDGSDVQHCEQRRFALGLRFSSYNLFHQQMFAAAIYDGLQHHMASDATLLPLGMNFPRERPDKRWEYTWRGFLTAPAEEVLRSMRALMLSSRCTCFEKLIAFTGGFDPYHPSGQQSVWSFRRASTRNARAALASSHLARVPDGGAAQDMLFVVRRGARRIITNEQELLSQVRAEQPRLRVVVLEHLTMTQQILEIATSAALIGVHGAALTGWISFLPTDVRKTAILEIRPKLTPLSTGWETMVRDLSRGLGVQFFVTDAEHAPGCKADALMVKYHQCAANRRLAAKCRDKLGKTKAPGRSVLWCNVTVSAPTLLPIIQLVAERTRR